MLEQVTAEDKKTYAATSAFLCMVFASESLGIRLEAKIVSSADGCKCCLSDACFRAMQAVHAEAGVAIVEPLKKSVAASKEVPPVMGNFTRTKKGRRVMVQEMRKLIWTDGVKFPAQPILDPTTDIIHSQAQLFQSVCAPFQYALSTRASSEALAREPRLATELEPGTTVLSVDGVGAYDHISRAAVFEGLRRDERLEPLIPYVRLFYGCQSTYLFHDAAGEAHVVEQAEGGEQGDPLMPGLFAVGVHGALLAASADLQPGKSLSAFLDDTYVTSHPNRTTAVFQIIRASLKRHANIDLHSGKTRAWNAAGVEPPGLRELLGERPNDPPTWVGDPGLAPERRGFMVLGTPLGSAAYVQAALRSKRQEHDLLLDTIPGVPDLQSAWLLLLLCGATRSNYLLRVLTPDETLEFASEHDTAVIWCLADLLANDQPLQLDPLACDGRTCRWRWAGLVSGRQPLGGGRHTGRFGLTLFLRCRGAAHRLWRMLAIGMTTSLYSPLALQHLPGRHLSCDLDPASRALLLSQAGPGGPRAVVALPTAPEFRLSSECMRVLLLRHLRASLPHAPRQCRCGGRLDALGDHPSACPTAGVLGPRGAPLERAAARVCREAGARVASNAYCVT